MLYARGWRAPGTLPPLPPSASLWGRPAGMGIPRPVPTPSQVPSAPLCPDDSPVTRGGGGNQPPGFLSPPQASLPLPVPNVPWWGPRWCLLRSLGPPESPFLSPRNRLSFTGLSGDCLPHQTGSLSRSLAGAQQGCGPGFPGASLLGLVPSPCLGPTLSLCQCPPGCGGECGPRQAQQWGGAGVNPTAHPFLTLEASPGDPSPQQRLQAQGQRSAY